jgi:hypothetical protein
MQNETKLTKEIIAKCDGVRQRLIDLFNHEELKKDQAVPIEIWLMQEEIDMLQWIAIQSPVVVFSSPNLDYLTDWLRKGKFLLIRWINHPASFICSCDRWDEMHSIVSDKSSNHGFKPKNIEFLKKYCQPPPDFMCLPSLTEPKLDSVAFAMSFPYCSREVETLSQCDGFLKKAFEGLRGIQEQRVEESPSFIPDISGSLKIVKEQEKKPKQLKPPSQILIPKPPPPRESSVLITTLVEESFDLDAEGKEERQFSTPKRKTPSAEGRPKSQSSDRKLKDKHREKESTTQRRTRNYVQKPRKSPKTFFPPSPPSSPLKKHSTKASGRSQTLKFNVFDRERSVCAIPWRR